MTNLNLKDKIKEKNKQKKNEKLIKKEKGQPPINKQGSVSEILLEVQGWNHQMECISDKVIFIFVKGNI